MRTFLEKSNRVLETPLDVAPRTALIVAALLLLPCYLFPLYDMTMFAPQYPDGLRLHIYSYKLQGGNGGQDMKEINLLNHYIGMKDLDSAEFTELKWIPFAVGAFGLLFGLGQFVTTFAITMGYVAFANRRLDPQAEALRETLERAEAGA